jgi:CelD/BcsL family acetyltransferase involved in cellulose biosynthesis
LVGYDVERLRNYSLGLLIVDELVCDAIRTGRSRFDLTVGDESYKTDFGGQPRPLFEIRLPRTPVGLTGQLARDGYLRSRQLAKKGLLAWQDRQRRKQQRRPQEHRRTDREQPRRHQPTG